MLHFGDFVPLRRLDDPADYRPDNNLEKAVEMALLLGRPLLVTGEPGVGKSQLGRYLAHLWSLVEGERFFVFNTKSTTLAGDLLYRYDALAHFRCNEALDDETVKTRFVTLQALGKAIASEAGRCLVLVDEIDKAPRDVPNDLLDVLEGMAFDIPEVGCRDDKRIRGKAEHRPFVLFTSNAERNLPDAFLRRCVYCHIAFPDTERFLEIVAAHNLLPGIDEAALRRALEHFGQVRQAARFKKPATDELLQWLAYLGHQRFPFEKMPAQPQAEPGELSATEHETLRRAYGLLLKDNEDLRNQLFLR